MSTRSLDGKIMANIKTRLENQDTVVLSTHYLGVVVACCVNMCHILSVPSPFTLYG